ncbi:MAG TPA: radical SAM protein, partial [Myxococcales bacterium]
MQLSRFTVTYEGIRPGEHVLYNVLEDRYAGVDDFTLRALTRWAAGEEPATREESESQEILLEDGFLVRERAEDDAHVRAYLDKAREGIPGTMYVTLMPTLQCNLACNYCFQKEHPAFTKMSSPTEDATLEWILRQVDERGLSTLHVHYFGGEPTTRKDYCLRTAEVFSAAMKARGGTFQWHMTTNAIHLDVEFAKRMETFGQGIFQVTLDGDKETHDRMRVYRDGRGTFDIIFDNVVALARAGCK